MIYLQVQWQGTMHHVLLPAHMAEAAARAAVKAGAEHHVLQGTWDSKQRKHVAPEINGAWAMGLLRGVVAGVLPFDFNPYQQHPADDLLS